MNEYTKKYKEYMCKQFKLSKNDFIIVNDKDLIIELEKQYKNIIETKEDIAIEKIIKNDELIRSKPLSLENIYTSGFVLIITIMLGFSSYLTEQSRVEYDILLFLAAILIIVTSTIKIYEHTKLIYYCGYHNMCLMILDKIEKEFEYKSCEEETNRCGEKINHAIKEITDIKDFIGIR